MRLTLRLAALFMRSVLCVAAIVTVSSCGQARDPAPPPSHLRVPEGFTIERVADPDLLDYPMFATLAGEGRLLVCAATAPNTMKTDEMLKAPSYRIRLLEDTDLDGTYDTSHVFADRIPFPMGAAVVGDSVYVAAAPDLLRFRDTNGDGVADEREVVLTGWRLHANGAAMGGPFVGPDGWLYITDARRGFEIRRKEGDVVSGRGPRIWRVRPDGTGLQWIAGGGFDNAVEIAFMPSGETIGTMTYFLTPRDGFRDALMHWVEGGVYPRPHQVIEDDGLALTGPLMPPMTKLARVAHSGLMRYRGRAFGPEYHDNLFSAQFNTGRVMRHVVSPDGATYRTVDEPFMTSTSADSHPTDVLEDADGSLLVVETGGWFIQGCPLSRVAKPEVEGGLYRIRRTDARPMADPWGRRGNIDAAAPANLVTLLDDDRVAVRDRAIERLVALGDASVGPLAGVLRQHADPEIRSAAVFALYRISTPAAAREVRAGLSDRSALVRTAAARAVGLARDREAVATLERLVLDDEAQVRRQAATALGQIGASGSVNALIEAAARPADRFVQHAVIHALITLGRAEPLVEALRHSSPDVRRAALIALDQMRPSPLTPQHLAPFLAPDAADLWETGAWVASHHPEWPDAITTFLRSRLDARPAENATLDLTDLLVTFCGQPPVQRLIGTRLVARATSRDERLGLLDVMQACPVKTLPDGWISSLATVLRNGEGPVRSRVLRLVEARSVAALHRSVTAIVRHSRAPARLRLEALGSLLTERRRLDAAEFRLVTEHLRAAHEPPLRQAAARVLGRAALTDDQLVTLARDHVTGADAFLLPALVEPFSASKSADVGRALIAALAASPERLDSLPADDLAALLGGYPADVQPEAARLLALARERQDARLSRLQAVEAALGRGDIGAGRRLFFGKSLCSTCHAVGGEGSRFGPDLTSIGDIRSRHDILESILFPSASFAREYDTYRVQTASATHTGLLKEQLADAIVIEVAPETAVRVPRADIVSIEPVSVSMMPPGLERMLSESELADLLAFLESLPDPIERPSRRESN